jgi:hypothetical protein
VVGPEGLGATTGDVDGLLDSAFSRDQRERAAQLLSLCGDLPESPRVQLAILKLAEGDLKALEHYVEQARLDYRDVLYWAFYYPGGRGAADPAQREE